MLQRITCNNVFVYGVLILHARLCNENHVKHEVVDVDVDVLQTHIVV